MLTNHGVHHLGLATHDMEATIEFYENVLGFKTRVCDIISPAAGGAIRHAFLDVGNGEMIAFMEYVMMYPVSTPILMQASTRVLGSLGE